MLEPDRGGGGRGVSVDLLNAGGDGGGGGSCKRAWRARAPNARTFAKMRSRRVSSSLVVGGAAGVAAAVMMSEGWLHVVACA